MLWDMYELTLADSISTLFCRETSEVSGNCADFYLYYIDLDRRGIFEEGNCRY